MSDDNKRNLLFFEAPTMRELFADMDQWQATNRKRLQSVSVQPDGNGFACIALSNPTEVIIVDGYGKGGALVADNCLLSHGPYNGTLSATKKALDDAIRGDRTRDKRRSVDEQEALKALHAPNK